MRDYKLKHFFLLILLLVVALGSLIAYGWRRNTPGDKVENGVDVWAPFYDNQKSDADTSHHDSTHTETTTH